MTSAEPDNARVRFNYTLQFADGTGSDPNAASGHHPFGSAEPPYPQPTCTLTAVTSSTSVSTIVVAAEKSTTVRSSTVRRAEKHRFRSFQTSVQTSPSPGVQEHPIPNHPRSCLTAQWARSKDLSTVPVCPWQFLINMQD